MTGTTAYKPGNRFEQDYLAAREKEGRIYSDGTVLQLPDLSRDHPHYTEWQLRKESATRLKHYFEKRLSLVTILEVGCGNGWLCHQLAYIPGSEVTGTDVNFTELQQAARVFSHLPNLSFIYGGIKAKEMEDKDYDFIVFASSIQYFPSLSGIVQETLLKLKTGGELHILDSPFYKPEEIEMAKKRTEKYYEENGFPGMTRHYFHHSLDDLGGLSFKVLYNPSFVNRHLLNNKSPFPWICIKKQ